MLLVCRFDVCLMCWVSPRRYQCDACDGHFPDVSNDCGQPDECTESPTTSPSMSPTASPECLGKVATPSKSPSALPSDSPSASPSESGRRSVRGRQRRNSQSSNIDLYELQPQGHCRAGAVYVQSKVECFENAVLKFGLTVSKKRDLEAGSSRHLPQGCFYKPSDTTLFFNAVGTTSYEDDDLLSICIGRCLDLCYLMYAWPMCCSTPARAACRLCWKWNLSE